MTRNGIPYLYNNNLLFLCVRFNYINEKFYVDTTVLKNVDMPCLWQREKLMVAAPSGTAEKHLKTVIEHPSNCFSDEVI